VGRCKMRIIIIGAVAAGTSAAAKARRNNEKAEIVLYLIQVVVCPIILEIKLGVQMS